MIYLGIDPGSRIIGYGFIETANGRVISAEYGVIKLNPKDNIATRIVSAYTKLTEIINARKPDKTAVESIFFGKNIKSAFTLGHLRGAIILAIAQFNLPVDEYSPREIKKAVTGNGNASKQQVQYMLSKLLPLKQIDKATPEIPEDAADALAVAFCLYNQDRFRAIPKR